MLCQHNINSVKHKMSVTLIFKNNPISPHIQYWEKYVQLYKTFCTTFCIIWFSESYMATEVLSSTPYHESIDSQKFTIMFWFRFDRDLHEIQDSLLLKLTSEENMEATIVLGITSNGTDLLVWMPDRQLSSNHPFAILFQK